MLSRLLKLFLFGFVCTGLGLLGTTKTTFGAASSLGLPCTYQIPSSVTKVDGAGNFAQVKPGDTLCLPAGTRGALKFYNLHGTAGNPITIQNSDGIVKLTGATKGMVNIYNSSYLHITGAGVESKCGAAYAPAGQACGIELDHTYKGFTFDPNGDVHDLEIDHVYVHDTSTAANTRGVAIHPKEGQTISGFYAHHNYIRNTHGEGFYIGSEPHGKSFDLLGKVKNVEISYNLVEQTGYDGIKIKVGIENIRVHHNVVRNGGTRREPKHETGILLATSVGEVYNNFVVAILEGIAMGRPLSAPGTRYFNNVVVGGEISGIFASESNPLIYNNTIVGSGAAGILAKGANAQIFDNIVVGITGPAIQGKSTLIFNNLTGTVADAGFVDAVNNDFHLLAESPAVDAGRNQGIFPPFDLDDVPRPQGLATDLGAYER